MEAVELRFFPYPHVLNGVRGQGVLIPWPEKCVTCRDRPCEQSTEDKLALCKYGINYWRMSPELLVAGVVVSDYGEMTAARRKAIRRTRSQVRKGDLEALRLKLREGLESDTRDVDARKQAVVDEFRQSREYETRVVELLQPQLREAFSQVHDYRQFVSQIISNINVLMRLRHPAAGTTEELLERASHEEKAIYWAARLMETKLEASLFLFYPERIAKGKRTRVQVHKFVTKHIRIYEHRFEEKDVGIRTEGASHGSIVGNDVALGVIPHSFLDNAHKYAPRGSTVVVRFDESDSDIVLSVGSFGPVIEADEKVKVFDLFFRGRHARDIEAEGTGVGLALTQAVAKELGIDIAFSQDLDTREEELVWTEFSATFYKQA